MHPATHARTEPDRRAYVMANSGEVVTYRQLNERSNQGAHFFRSLGLKAGDVIAVFMENNARYFEIAWAAQRSGLYFTCIPSRMTADEVAYILKDSDSKLLISSQTLTTVTDELLDLSPDIKFMTVGGNKENYENYEESCKAMPTAPIVDETSGMDMLYSSGTTGRPKGIKPPLSGMPIDTPDTLTNLAVHSFGFREGCVYLSPTPLYHSAPLRWGMAIHRLGGTVIVMEKFDAERALALIEEYHCDCAQFVPTHFVRMLKLPEQQRMRYDLSSLKSALHAAAPCPIPVKDQMLAWWGPIIYEYYGGTEGIGFCAISAVEWLTHKGSVGRALLGTLRICGEDSEILPPGQEGGVFFADGPPLCYHNAPEKVAENTNKYGWTTLGDVGWVDEDGYLYLTDRKSFMIISGGVNIYPQEIENLLVSHPKVADAAVIGAPDEEMGEKVVAVIQPLDTSQAGDELRDELLSWLRTRLSSIKMPRRLDFVRELPRHPTGKLYKRLVRDSYWGREGTAILLL